MKKHLPALPYFYACITIICTFLIGQFILWFTPDGTSIWASLLFILINLLPMLLAFVFVRISGEISGMGKMIKAAFRLHESGYAYAAALAVPIVYYGTSTLLGNVTFTGSPFSAAIAYFPWTLLQGGLEEVGWRWYLQTHIAMKKSFALKMLVISAIWFVWHIPIYRLPWVTAGSSNFLVFFLMILGNTFTLGAVKELSKGSIPCICAHMLIDTAAACMLVGSDLIKVALLAGVEIVLSVITVNILGGRQKQQSCG
ncbi:MAG: CPBP family intramembrane glutamic endopeptidase [Candidatus Spyradocola sp.]